MTMDSVGCVGFIYDIGDEQTHKAVKYFIEYLKERKIEYKGLAINFNPGKYPETVLDSNIKLISKGDLSSIGVPDPRSIEKVISDKIDLYLDFCFEYNFTHDYIARSSKAPFKVGHFDSDYHTFDLIVRSADVENTPLDYIKHVIHYLSSIKSLSHNDRR